jgi:hypothetical protein
MSIYRIAQPALRRLLMRDFLQSLREQAMGNVYRKNSVMGRKRLNEAALMQDPERRGLARLPDGSIGGTLSPGVSNESPELTALYQKAFRGARDIENYLSARDAEQRNKTFTTFWGQVLAKLADMNVRL